ncbi:MAG: hypothetical protein AAGC60_22740 [Acidobacteriota bacterium]
MIRSRDSQSFASVHALVAAVVLAGSFVAVPLSAQDAAVLEPVDEAQRLEALSLRGTVRGLLLELFEQAGDFGGYAGPAWDLIESFDLELVSPGAVEAAYRADLEAGLDPATAAAVRDFWASPLGEKVVWLRREEVKVSGIRGRARSGRHVVERTAPERLAVLEQLDEATLESATAIQVATVAFGVVEAAGGQILSTVGDEAEWSEEPADIQRWIGDAVARGERDTLIYRLNRLDTGELDAFLAFATSAAGQQYYAARSAARVAGAQRMAEALVAAQTGRLADELWEYRREEDDDGEEDDRDS